jgi:hypothetical protein
MIQRRTNSVGGHWLLLLALLTAGLAGCKGEYERRLELQVDELRKGSGFKDLTQSVAIVLPSASVTLSLPPDLAEVDAKADPRRLKLTLAAPLAENKLSDMRTYEGTVEGSDHGKQYYYLYVGSVNLAAGGNDDLSIFLGNVKEAVRALPAMQDVQVVTRDGSMVTCRKCRVAASQVFYYTKPDASGDYSQPTEGLIEIWDYPIEAAKKHLVLVWRVRTVEGKAIIDLDKKAELIAGGISVSAK